jgi:hypothetical protein
LKTLTEIAQNYFCQDKKSYLFLTITNSVRMSFIVIVFLIILVVIIISEPYFKKLILRKQLHILRIFIQINLLKLLYEKYINTHSCQTIKILLAADDSLKCWQTNFYKWQNTGPTPNLHSINNKSFQLFGQRKQTSTSAHSGIPPEEAHVSAQTRVFTRR